MAQRKAKHNRARAHEEIVDRVRYVEHIAEVSQVSLTPAARREIASETEIKKSTADA
jgi:hypothetical protein